MYHSRQPLESNPPPFTAQQEKLSSDFFTQGEMVKEIYKMLEKTNYRKVNISIQNHESVATYIANYIRSDKKMYYKMFGTN